MSLWKLLSIFARIWEVFQPKKKEPDPEPLPVEPPPDQPSVEEASEAPDNTWVWKPETDTMPRRACVITPASLDLESVTVYYGREQAKCEIAKYRGPRANGNRQHWLLTRVGRAYGKKIKVVGLDRKLQTEHTWKVADGAARVEVR